MKAKQDTKTKTKWIEKIREFGQKWYWLIMLIAKILEILS